MITRGGLVLFLTLVAACVDSLPPEAPTRPAPKAAGAALRVGDRAPDFDVMNASRNTGDRIRLVQGKVNLVYFWETSSPSDKEAMPVISELRKRLGDKGLSVAAISVDDDVLDVARVGVDMGATFDVGWDETKAAKTRYKPPKIPTFFIVDKAGVVRFMHVGFHDGLEGELEREAASLL